MNTILGLALLVIIPPFFFLFRFPYTLMSTTHCRPHRALFTHIYLLAASIYSLLIHTIFTPISVFFSRGYLQRTVSISSHDLLQFVSIAHTHGSRIILLTHLCYTCFHMYITFPKSLVVVSHIHFNLVLLCLTLVRLFFFAVHCSRCFIVFIRLPVIWL